MNEFNSCAHLINKDEMKEVDNLYDELLKKGENPLEYMLNLQLNLQKQLNDKLPERNPIPTKLKTCGEILDYIKSQDDSIDDERRELYTALGGMSNGKNASAIWKSWKEKNQEFRNKFFSDLSDEDRLEVLFEAIDQIHFQLNQMLALGLNSADIFKLYILKNLENSRRYKNNY